MSPNTEAWIYCAVSSGKQEATLEDQLAWGYETAAKNGWTVTREFGKDREGVGSGKEGVRKILERLLVALQATPKAQRPGRVLMIRLDRLGRGDSLEPIEYFSKIRRLGVIIHTRDDGDNTVGNALEAIKPILKLVTGSLENEARRDKSLAAHAKRKAQGKSWRAPIGLKVTADHRLAIDDETAHLVREAFTLRSQGWGYVAIGSRLRAMSHTRSWTRSFVMSMLERRTYRGLLIPEDLFDSIQGRPGTAYRNRSTTRYPWPLAGALKCVCGHLVHGSASGRDKWRVRYYFCDNLNAHEKRVLFRADDIEAQFVDRLKELSASKELVDVYRKRPADARTDLSKRLSELEAKLKDIDKQRAFVWTMQPYVHESEVGKRLEVIRAEELELEGAINATKREIAAAAASETILRDAGALITNMAKVWPHLPVQDQQRAARAVASAFTVYVEETDPYRIRGPKAKRFSATGRVHICVQQSENRWTEVATRLTAWATS